jgi:hypothetical protein
MSAAAMAAWVNIPLTYIQQTKDLWCWAASSAMAVRAAGFIRTQTRHAVQAIYGVNSTNTDAPNVTRTAVQIKNDFSNIYSISATKTGTITLTTVRAKINANKPILAGVLWSGGGGHMVVIAGYDNSCPDLKIFDSIYGTKTWSYDGLSYYYESAGTWAETIYWN